MTDNISLDQVRAEDRFDFRSIYEIDDFDDEVRDSPYTEYGTKCNYCDPVEFQQDNSERLNYDSFFHLNCRSLSANWESFNNLLCELHGDKFSFDFIGVTEVFECSRDKRLHLTGYHDIITRTRDDSNRGGVGLFISNNISFTIREDLSVFIPHIYESLFIEVKSSNKHMNTQIVGVIYRPNSQPRADIDMFSITYMK